MNKDELIEDLINKVDTLAGFLNVKIDSDMAAGIKSEWEDYKAKLENGCSCHCHLDIHRYCDGTKHVVRCEHCVSQM